LVLYVGCQQTNRFVRLPQANPGRRRGQDLFVRGSRPSHRDNTNSREFYGARAGAFFCSSVELASKVLLSAIVQYGTRPIADADAQSPRVAPALLLDRSTRDRFGCRLDRMDLPRDRSAAFRFWCSRKMQMIPNMSTRQRKAFLRLGVIPFRTAPVPPPTRSLGYLWKRSLLGRHHQPLQNHFRH